MPDESVIRVAKLFGIEVHLVTRVGGGFSNASVFRVQSPDGKPFAIRRTPVTAAMPDGRTRALHRLLRAVSGTGVVAVPVPIQPDLTQLIRFPRTESVQVEESWVTFANGLWQAEPWMSGTTVGPEISNEQLYSASQCLHAFHLAAEKAVTSAGPNEWFFLKSDFSPGLFRRLSIAAELSAGMLPSLKTSAEADPDLEFRVLALRVCASLESWLPWLQHRLTQLSGWHFSLQPVVRDLWRAHVLFRGDQVTGLIDFNAAATDHVGLDVSRLFRSWFGSDVQRIREAVEHFSALRRLSPIELSLLEAFDASTVLLSPVTWLRRRFDCNDRTPCRDDVKRRLSELTQVAEQFQPLFSQP